MRRCLGCGTPVMDPPDTWADSKAHQEYARTVNLTPDALFVAMEIVDYPKPLFEEDTSYNWCDVDCFGLWLAKAVRLCPAPERPSELQRALRQAIEKLEAEPV